MANIKVETQSGKAGFVDESTEISGIAHLTGGVLHTNPDARMMRMQNQMLQGAERGIAFARIGHFARTAHVQDEPRVGQIIGDVDGTLQFVHGFDAANALDFADGKRHPALPHDAEVPAGRSVQRDELQAVRFERAGHRANFRLHRVFEVAARAENLEAFKAGPGNLLQEFRSQFSRYEQVRRE